MDGVTESSSIGKSGTLSTLDRGLLALEAIAQSEGGLTAKELAGMLGVNRGTSYQILRTLIARGYVRREPGGNHLLGMRLGLLLRHFGTQVVPDQILVDMVDEIHDQLNETAYCALYESSGEVVIAAIRESSQLLRVASLHVGYSENLHARASGKALLAYLNDERVREILSQRGMAPMTKNTHTDADNLLSDLVSIRSRGWAVDNEEFTEGVMCVATPFFDASGNPMGALSVSGPSFRISSRLGHIGSSLVVMGEKASRHFGYAGAYPPET